jgi:hypothetical protein
MNLRLKATASRAGLCDDGQLASTQVFGQRKDSQ